MNNTLHLCKWKQNHRKSITSLKVICSMYTVICTYMREQIGVRIKCGQRRENDFHFRDWCWWSLRTPHFYICRLLLTVFSTPKLSATLSSFSAPSFYVSHLFLHFSFDLFIYTHTGGWMVTLPFFLSYSSAKETYLQKHIKFFLTTRAAKTFKYWFHLSSSIRSFLVEGLLKIGI